MVHFRFLVPSVNTAYDLLWFFGPKCKHSTNDPLRFLVPSVNTVDTLSEEDQLKALAHQKMKKEYKNAVQVEGLFHLFIIKGGVFALLIFFFNFIVNQSEKSA